MGKLSRRVKFIAAERRLSIPAEFLHAHQIQRGDVIHLAVRGSSLFAVPARSLEGYRALGRQMGAWFPDARHPFFSLFDDAVALHLGSQDRVVLPREFPYHPRETVRLHWEMVDGLLHLMAESEREPENAPAARIQGQISLMDYLPAAASTADRAVRPSFDRRESELTLVERVPVASIDARDRTYADKSPLVSDAMLRSIRLEGIRRPLLLALGTDGRYRVVDGFRRLTAARAVKLTQVPALVWRSPSHEDCLRLKLLEQADESGEAPTLKRLKSTLKLHEGQVDLQEIEQITGRRKRTLQRYLRVAADPVLREAIESGRLSIFKAEEILKAGVDPESAIRSHLTVKDIRAQSPRTPAPRRARRGTTPRRRNGRAGGLTP